MQSQQQHVIRDPLSDPLSRAEYIETLLDMGDHDSANRLIQDARWSSDLQSYFPGCRCHQGEPIYRAFLRLWSELFNEVAENSIKLLWQSPSIQAHPKMALNAIISNGKLLASLNKSLRKDYFIVLAAVSNFGLALIHADDNLKANIDIVSAAVEQNGLALMHAAPILKANLKIVILALINDPDALNYAAQQLQSDPDLIFLAAIEDPQDRANVGQDMIRQYEQLSKVEDNYRFRFFNPIESREIISSASCSAESSISQKSSYGRWCICS